MKQKQTIDYPHFFITGSQRSGTTLLRLLLNNHSNIAIPEEGSFLLPFIQRNRLTQVKPLSNSARERFLNYIIADEQFKKWKINEADLSLLRSTEFTYKQAINHLYETFGDKHGKQVVGDKSPKFIRKLDVLSEIYSSSKFIHIIRDGRDTYLSFKKRQHHSVTTAALAAAEWRAKEQLIQRTMRKLGTRSRQVRYEDLIASPEQQLSKICRFLGLDFETGMLEFWVSSEEYIDKQHSELIFKPIDSANTKKWKTGLTARQVDEYEFVSRNQLKAYQYPIINEHTKLQNQFKYLMRLLFSIPKRFVRIIWITFALRLSSRFGLRLSKWFYE